MIYQVHYTSYLGLKCVTNVEASSKEEAERIFHDYWRSEPVDYIEEK